MELVTTHQLPWLRGSIWQHRYEDPVEPSSILWSTQEACHYHTEFLRHATLQGRACRPAHKCLPGEHFCQTSLLTSVLSLSFDDPYTSQRKHEMQCIARMQLDNLDFASDPIPPMLYTVTNAGKVSQSSSSVCNSRPQYTQGRKQYPEMQHNEHQPNHAWMKSSGRDGNIVGWTILTEAYVVPGVTGLSKWVWVFHSLSSSNIFSRFFCLTINIESRLIKLICHVCLLRSVSLLSVCLRLQMNEIYVSKTHSRIWPTLFRHALTKICTRPSGMCILLTSSFNNNRVRQQAYRIKSIDWTEKGVEMVYITMRNSISEWLLKRM